MCQGRCGAADSGAPEITDASRACAQVSRFTEQLAFLSVRCCLFSFWREDSLSKQTQGVWLAASVWKGRVGFFLILIFSFAFFWLPEETEVLQRMEISNITEWLCSLEVGTGTHSGLKLQSVLTGTAVLLNVGSLTWGFPFSWTIKEF